MKYYRVQSDQNTTGVWVDEDGISILLQSSYFKGHDNITQTEISEEEYMERLMARLMSDLGDVL